MRPEDRQRIGRRFVELQAQGYCPSRTSRIAGDREMFVLLKTWSAGRRSSRHASGASHNASPIRAGQTGQVRYATAAGYGPYDHLEGQ